MKKIIYLLAILFPLEIFAQKETIDKGTPMVYVEQKIEVEGITEDASFEGGIEAFRKTIYEQFNLANVPKEEIVAFHKTGRNYFYVVFSIDETGTATDFNSKEISTTNQLFKEAVRVISLKKWTSAKRNGVNVSQKMVIPIVVHFEE